MTMLPKGVKVHVALGVTDMRKGLDGLAMLVQGTLQQDPFSGHLFAFRGRRADLIKIVFWDGSGLCLFTKRLEQRHFPWPVAAETGGTVTLAYLKDVLDRLSQGHPMGQLDDFLPWNWTPPTL
jgi:transposase